MSKCPGASPFWLKVTEVPAPSVKTEARVQVNRHIPHAVIVKDRGRKQTFIVKDTQMDASWSLLVWFS